MLKKITSTFLLASVAATVLMTSAVAGPLADRIEEGKSIRIGFANIPFWGFPDKDGNADGFTNDIAIETLKKMGYTNIESVVTDWGALIPGLKAERFDLITGGMYILKSRCKNVSFSEPVAKAGDAFLVPTGNPNNLHNYTDVLNAKKMLVTGAGYNTVEAAHRVGIDDKHLMQVPGPTEMLAAVKAGRADAAVLTYFEASHLAHDNEEVELGDNSRMPPWSKNFAGIGFRHEDADILAKFNEALAEYLGTDEMMEKVADHEYGKDHLPGDVTAKWACENR